MLYKVENRSGFRVQRLRIRRSVIGYYFERKYLEHVNRCLNKKAMLVYSG